MKQQKRNLIIGITAAVVGSMLFASSILLQFRIFPAVNRLLSSINPESWSMEWDSGAVLMYKADKQSDSWTVHCRKAYQFKKHATLTFTDGQFLQAEVSCGKGDDLRLYLYQQGGEEQCWDVGALSEPLMIPLTDFVPGKLKLRLETNGAEDIDAAFTLQSEQSENLAVPEP